MFQVFFLLAFAHFPSTATAARIDPRATVHASACSSYLFAGEYEHAASGYSNFSEKVKEACLEKGFSEFEVISYTWTPGINVSHFCINGIALCK